MTSDIIRFAAVNMRIAEFFEAMTPAFKEKDTTTRVTFNHFEVVAACWLWLRQVHLVRGALNALTDTVTPRLILFTHGCV